jgi:threonyl-tRNA synthetase
MNNSHPELDNLRHSAAHLLAAAALKMYPGTKITIGPAIDNGFYYDFEFPDGTDVSDKDFPRIEKNMRELVKSWKGFEKIDGTPEEAREMFKDNPYKLELIEEILGRGESLTFYKSGEFVDLCRGGHVENPKEQLKFFKLMSIAGAYWRGDEKNKMLSRIYGTAFPSQEELDAYMKQVEEAKARDHKKLGKELDLFIFSELVGKGLPLWTPKGATIRRELERFIVDEELARGYQHVYTPDIAQVKLYETSGHYPYYKESMYAPIEIDDEKFMLRPMTCPHHFELFRSRPRSYKELPMRIAELAKLYRYEQSGELQGLLRVRSFCLADAHIIATKDQAADEIHGALDLIEYAAGAFGLKPNEDYWYRLSLGDRSDDKKYFKSDQEWDSAEDVLREVLRKRDVRSYEAPGEAAFYGPKIDIQMKNVNGKEDTAFTVQYDFVMPKRFELRYIDEDNTEKEPIVIHRSSIGAIERVMAFLIERYAGAFPLWLAPVQVSIIPVSESHHDLARRAYDTLRKAGLRPELRNEQKSMGWKIRQSALQKVPYAIIIGDNEASQSNDADIFASPRSRDGKDLGMQSLNAFISNLRSQIETKQ